MRRHPGTPGLRALVSAAFPAACAAGAAFTCGALALGGAVSRPGAAAAWGAAALCAASAAAGAGGVRNWRRRGARNAGAGAVADPISGPAPDFAAAALPALRELAEAVEAAAGRGCGRDQFVSRTAAARRAGGALGALAGAVEGMLLRLEQGQRRIEQVVAAYTSQGSRCRVELAAIRESALDCIIVMDDRGRITEFNPAAERTFGYKHDDVVGKDLSATILPPALAAAHAAGLTRYLRTGEGPVLNKRIEVTAIRADGSEFPVELAVTPFFLEGRPSFVAYLRDITERRRAEAESRQAAKLALVASRTDNAVIITDVDGRIEWVNEGFTRISGYTLEEVRGKKPGPVLQGPGTDPATVAYVRSQLAKGEGFQVEILNYAKDGRPYWLAIEAQPVRDEQGRLTQFMAVESDVTERKRAQSELQQAKELAERARAEAEEARVGAEAAKAAAEAAKAAAEAANRAKSEFLANMSHEIRTPLNGVIGMTDLLLSTELTAAQRKFAATAKSSAGTLLAVINQILDFSKIEAGKLELESIEFSPRTVVEEVAEMLAHKAVAKNLELAHRVADDVPALLRGDPDRLRQVLINLVNNAIKFTDRGEVVVRVGRGKWPVVSGQWPEGTEAAEAAAVAATMDPSPLATASSPVSLLFTVTDSGVGVPPDRVGRLFKSFSQVDASTTRRYGGTGLGLAICKRLVELMGGEIGVASNADQRGSAGTGTGAGDGRGSTFWFTAAFGPAAEAEAPAAAAHPAAGPDLRGLRVLAVDDNAACARILAEQLSAWGMAVETAGDQSAALESAARAAASGRPFDLALLDMLMPDATAADVARALRRAPGGAAVRLVLMASADNPVDEAQMAAAGFAGCVSKPVRPSQLFDEMMRVLAKGAGRGAKRGAARSAGGSDGHSAAPGGGVIPSPARAGEVLILLAEDNEVNQMVAVEILGRAGYRCDVVADGRGAVRAVAAKRYDLVLMDCQMPEMDGFEATRAIRKWEAELWEAEGRGVAGRERDPTGHGDRGLVAAASRGSAAGGARRLPVIALTANAIKGDRERCLEAGMDDYVSKPLDPRQLVERIEAALDRFGRREPARCPESAVRTASAAVGSAAPAAPAEAAEAAGPGGCPFDVDDLLNRCLGDQAFLCRILDKFREQAEAMLDELGGGIAAADPARVARVAHGIKGAAANLSAVRAAELAARLEALGKAGALDGVRSAFADLRAEVERCVAHIPAVSGAAG